MGHNNFLILIGMILITGCCSNVQNLQITGEITGGEYTHFYINKSDNYTICFSCQKNKPYKLTSTHPLLKNKSEQELINFLADECNRLFKTIENSSNLKDDDYLRSQANLLESITFILSIYYKQRLALIEEKLGIQENENAE